MKKSSKILGSVALSAALMMGTAVPAFANPTAPNVPDPMTDAPVSLTDATSAPLANSQESGASTVVTVSTYTSQLNVTVPLYLPIYLDTVGTPSDGTMNAIVPTSGQYYIKNSSPVNVTVSSARFVNVNEKIFLGTSTTTDSKFSMSQNTYKMKLSVKGNTTATPLELQADSKTGLGNQGYKQQDLGWILPAKPQTGDAEKTILDVTAFNGSLTQGISNEKLASIIYTVGVTSQTVPGIAEGYVPSDSEDAVEVIMPKSSTLIKLTTGKAVAELAAFSGLNNLKVVIAGAPDTDISDSTDTIDIDSATYKVGNAEAAAFGTETTKVLVPSADTEVVITLTLNESE